MQAITAFVRKRKSLLVRVMTVVLPLVILVALLATTVFAQKTYVITDGDQVKVYTTFSSDPAAVLGRAGVELGEDDTYTTTPGDGVSEIMVQRNQHISIRFCGEEVKADSYGESLNDLLTRLDIPTSGDYVVSMPLTTETYDGMEVVVDCIVEMKQTHTVDIPYETVECLDPTLPEGTKQVKVQGVNGQLQKTANVTYVNSEQTASTVIDEKVVQQPVNEIVLVGTGTEENEVSNAPAIGNGVIVTADGEVLTYSRKEKFRATAYTHTDAGCDMTTATGTTVRVGAIAVDPKLIAYGTRMFIVSNDGKYIYGIATAEDCGGGIKGDQVDLYFPTTKECFQFGKRAVTIYFLD